MAIFSYIVLCVLPAAAVELIARGFTKWSTHGELTPGPKEPRKSKRSWRRRRKCTQTVPVPTSRSAYCDRYCDDLRRLSATYDQLRNAEIPARALRLRAVEVAYDDILRDACSALELTARRITSTR